MAAALDHDSTVPSDPTRVHALHGRMVEAMLEGGGLRAIARLAAQGAGGRVVIDLAHDVLAASTPGDGDAVALSVPILAGPATIGTVSLHVDGPPSAGAADALHATVMAALTYVALRHGDDPRHDAGARLVDAVLDGAPHALARLREAGLEAGDALTAQLLPHRTGRVVAALADQAPGTARTIRDDWVHALLPPEVSAPRIAAQLHERFGVAAAGAITNGDPVVALREARLAAQLVVDGAAAPEALAGGTWRLLVRNALRAPDELAALATNALGPLLDDDSPATADQLRTFAAYVANDCNMTATAAAIPAHRHTVAYRLERVRELTGLDPFDGEDREQLGVALKAHAVATAHTKLTTP
jgi:PucR family transcriptional regulator, purine catabolism regulatory protein